MTRWILRSAAIFFMIQKEECSSTLDTINLDSQGKVGMCFPTVFCSCYNVLVFFIVFLSFIYEGCPQTFFFSKLENVLKVQKAENPCTKRWAESEQLICETVKTVDSPAPFFFSLCHPVHVYGLQMSNRLWQLTVHLHTSKDPERTMEPEHRGTVTAKFTPAFKTSFNLFSIFTLCHTSLHNVGVDVTNAVSTIKTPPTHTAYCHKTRSRNTCVADSDLSLCNQVIKTKRLDEHPRKPAGKKRSHWRES